MVGLDFFRLYFEICTLIIGLGLFLLVDVQTAFCESDILIDDHLIYRIQVEIHSIVVGSASKNADEFELIVEKSNHVEKWRCRRW